LSDDPLEDSREMGLIIEAVFVGNIGRANGARDQIGLGGGDARVQSPLMGRLSHAQPKRPKKMGGGLIDGRGDFRHRQLGGQVGLKDSQRIAQPRNPAHAARSEALRSGTFEVYRHGAPPSGRPQTGPQ
jgi:hypothetical protein